MDDGGNVHEKIIAYKKRQIGNIERLKLSNDERDKKIRELGDEIDYERQQMRYGPQTVYVLSRFGWEFDPTLLGTGAAFSNHKIRDLDNAILDSGAVNILKFMRVLEKGVLRYELLEEMFPTTSKQLERGFYYIAGSGAKGKNSNWSKPARKRFRALSHGKYDEPPVIKKSLEDLHYNEIKVTSEVAADAILQGLRNYGDVELLRLEGPLTLPKDALYAIELRDGNGYECILVDLRKNGTGYNTDFSYTDKGASRKNKLSGNGFVDMDLSEALKVLTGYGDKAVEKGKALRKM